MERATIVQHDIAEGGRGSANLEEFYRQNHTWAEGLISAAKEVGWCVWVWVCVGGWLLGRGSPRRQRKWACVGVWVWVCVGGCVYVNVCG